MQFRFYPGLVFLLGCCVILSSCSKDNSPGNGDSYLRFTVNGQKIEYRSVPTALISTSGGANSMMLVAYKDFKVSTVDIQEHMSITLYSQSGFTTGATYKDPVKVPYDGSEMPQILITHADKNKALHQSVGIYADETGVVRLGWGGVGTALSNVADSKLTITELTDRFVKGTFSGTMYQPDSWINGTPFTITNGEFAIKRY